MRTKRAAKGGQFDNWPSNYKERLAIIATKQDQILSGTFNGDDQLNENSDKQSMTGTDASTSGMQSIESRDWTGLMQTSSNSKDGVERVEKVLHMYDIVFKDKDPVRSAPVRSHANRQAAREQKRKSQQVQQERKSKKGRHDCRRIIRTTYGHDGQIKKCVVTFVANDPSIDVAKESQKKEIRRQDFSIILVESNLLGKWHRRALQ